jgi:6-pyruvoyl-tetrahydropterin synthase
VYATFSLIRPFIADHFHDLPGFVEEQHRHDWIAEATFFVINDNEELAIAIIFDSWINQVQFTLLNDQIKLKGRNPTAESLAQWLFNFLEDNHQKVTKVKIQEKANYWASCSKIDISSIN